MSKTKELQRRHGAKRESYISHVCCVEAAASPFRPFGRSLSDREGGAVFACVGQGLIPLTSMRAAEMKSYLDPTEDDDFTEVELTLDVTCTTDATMDVTSDMLMPDPRYPDIVPVHQVCIMSISCRRMRSIRLTHMVMHCSRAAARSLAQREAVAGPKMGVYGGA